MRLVKQAIRAIDGKYTWAITTLSLSAIFYNTVPMPGQKIAWALIIFVSFITFCVLGLWAAMYLQEWARD